MVGYYHLILFYVYAVLQRNTQRFFDSTVNLLFWVLKFAEIYFKVF